MHHSVSDTAPRPKKFKLVLLVALLVLLFLCAIAWQFIPLKHCCEAQKLLSLAHQLKTHPLASLGVILVYTFGGLVAFPVFVLIPVTALIFGPLPGALYSLLGVFANASVVYGLGHVLGHRTVRRLAGNRVNQVSQQLARHSILTIATLRFLPLAPFTIINLIAGASHIRYREYTLGTLIGIIPAIVIMSLLGTQLKKMFLDFELLWVL